VASCSLEQGQTRCGRSMQSGERSGKTLQGVAARVWLLMHPPLRLFACRRCRGRQFPITIMAEPRTVRPPFGEGRLPVVSSPEVFNPPTHFTCKSRCGTTGFSERASKGPSVYSLSTGSLLDFLGLYPATAGHGVGGKWSGGVYGEPAAAAELLTRLQSENQSHGRSLEEPTTASQGQ
jgi:hypothetical protein